MGITRDSQHKRRLTGGKKPTHHMKRKHEMGRQMAMTKIGAKRIRDVRVRGGSIKHRALRADTGNFSWGSEVCTRKTRILDVVYNASNNELVRTKTLVKNAIVQIDATCAAAPPRLRARAALRVRPRQRGLRRRRSRPPAGAPAAAAEPPAVAPSPLSSASRRRRAPLAHRLAHRLALRSPAPPPPPPPRRPFRQWYEAHYGVSVGRKKKKVEEGAEPEAPKKQSKSVLAKISKRQETRVIDANINSQFDTGRLLACVSSRPGQCGRVDGYVLEGKELEFYVKKMARKKK